MRIVAVLALALTLAQAALAAPWQRVISYGADLSPEDRVAVVRDFNLPPDVDPGQIPSVVVEHAEEIRLLQRTAPPEIIGTRAVSSVYIEGRNAGDGLAIAAKNITWVTSGMYANALATAGVRDAYVVVTAPSPVSGTAALAGIFKAFSYLTGRTLVPEAEEAAADELVRMGELGQLFGQEPARIFMQRTKEEVLQSRATTYDEVRTIIARTAREQDLSLSETQTQLVAEVMIRLSKLGLNPANLRTQLKNFTSKPEQQAGGITGLIAKIVAFLQSLFKQLLGFVGRFVKI